MAGSHLLLRARAAVVVVCIGLGLAGTAPIPAVVQAASASRYPTAGACTDGPLLRNACAAARRPALPTPAGGHVASSGAPPPARHATTPQRVAVPPPQPGLPVAPVQPFTTLPTPFGFTGSFIGPNGHRWTVGQNAIDDLVAPNEIVAHVAPAATSAVLGADGNVWFTECGQYGGGNISGFARMTPAGQLLRFQTPNCPQQLAHGPDARIWFIAGGNYIYAATVGSNYTVTQYPVFTNSAIEYASTGLIVGYDGSLIFSGYEIDTTKNPPQENDLMGRIGSNGAVTLIQLATTQQVAFGTAPIANGAGATWTAFADGKVASLGPGGTNQFASGFPTVVGLAGGPDGAMWATASAYPPVVAGYVLRIGAGNAITQWEVSGASSSLGPIGQGPDGRMWFTLGYSVYYPQDGIVWAIATDGTTTGEVQPSAFDRGIGSAVGPDGAMWALLNDCTGHLTVTRTPLDASTVHAWYISVPRDPAGFCLGGPEALATGADGNLWFASPESEQVGRITPAGVITLFQVPAGISSPTSITAGPDGNLWFALGFGRYLAAGGAWEIGAASVGRITPAGVVTMFSLPSGYYSGDPITHSNTTVFAGATNAVTGAASVVAVDVAGNVTVREFPGTGCGAGGTCEQPNGLTIGPDAAVWSTLTGSAHAVGRMPAQGTPTTFQFGVGCCIHTFDIPSGITAYPDGTLYFMSNFGGILGRITTAGVTEAMTLPYGNGDLNALSVGGDSNLWLAGSPGLRRNASGSGPDPAEAVGGGSYIGYPTTCHVGQPVNCATGEFWHHLDGISIPARGVAFGFSESYSTALASTNGPLGYGWTHSDSAHLAVDGTTGVVTVTLPTGSAYAFAPTSGGYVAASRVLASLTAQGDGTWVLAPFAGRTRYIFSPAGQLTTAIDRNGYQTVYGYTSGALTSITDPAGRVITITYATDGTGHIATVTDPAGRTLQFGYHDGAGNLTDVTDVGGHTTHFTYDPAHRVLTLTDPRGGVTTNTYDSAGRVHLQTDAMQRSTTFAYTVGPVKGTASTTITDALGQATVNRFFDGQLISTTKAANTPLKATWVYAYDPVSMGLAAVTDPLGHTVASTYDAQGNLLSTTDALGRTTVYTYDSSNELFTTTDPSGEVSTRTYDGNGNLSTVSEPLAGTTQTLTTTYTYGDATHPGDITGVTDPNGHTRTSAWDTYGNLAQAVDATGGITTMHSDIVGRRQSATSPRGNVSGGNPAAFTTTFSTDAYGAVLSTTDPLGHTSATSFDAAHNPSTTTDADGRVTTYTYNLDNQLTFVTQPDQTQTGTQYDKDGDVTVQVDALNHATTYTYNALQEMVTATDPLDRTTRYGYDPAGRRTSLTSPDGLVTTYGYDAAGELTTVHYSSAATPSVKYTYDLDGRRATMTDGSGTTTDTYDSVGRLTKVVDGAGDTVLYGIDAAGNVSSLTYPSGPAVTRTFDAANRLATVDDGLGHSFTFGYDADGNLTTRQYPNGITDTHGYDAAGHLTTIADTHGTTPVLSFTYTRDNAAQLLTMQATGATPTQESYGYTQNQQLATVNSAATYGYDNAANLITNGATTLAYDNGGQLSTTTVGSAVTSYTYNQRGDRTAGGSAVLGYDQANRLVTAGGATYAYDGTGALTQKTVGATTERYTWDSSSSPAPLLQDGATRFICGPNNVPIEQVNGDGSVFFLHQDDRNSTRALSDATGTVVAQFGYDAYGKRTSATGTASSPIAYDGQYLDPTTGMYMLRARTYDPVTAQFLTRDPLASATRQPYAYGMGNPLLYDDPTGQEIHICGNATIDYGGAESGSQLCYVHADDGWYVQYTLNAGGNVDLSLDPFAQAHPEGTFGISIGGGNDHVESGSSTGTYAAVECGNATGVHIGVSGQHDDAGGYSGDLGVSIGAPGEPGCGGSMGRYATVTRKLNSWGDFWGSLFGILPEDHTPPPPPPPRGIVSCW